MTKEQERAALKKIAKIIEECGADSYIGMTFAGIVEQAEDNITNDFANNYKDAYERTRELYNRTKAEIEDERKKDEEVREELQRVRTWYNEQKKRNTELLQEIEEASNDIGKYIDQQHSNKNEIEALQAEIIELKAKLYDLMTK